MVKYANYQSPIGKIIVAKSDVGLCYLALPGLADSFNRFTAKYFPAETVRQDRNDCREIITQLEEYFAGERTEFTLTLDLRTTPFYQEVLEQVARVNYGQTTSYGQIAQALGKPTAVRAVGGANARNPIPIVIPCHRVLSGGGHLNGYAGGLMMKAYLLRLEGIEVDA